MTRDEIATLRVAVDQIAESIETLADFVLKVEAAAARQAEKDAKRSPRKAKS
jgi:hypothetical protein